MSCPFTRALEGAQGGRLALIGLKKGKNIYEFRLRIVGRGSIHKHKLVIIMRTPPTHTYTSLSACVYKLLASECGAILILNMLAGRRIERGR